MLFRSAPLQQLIDLHQKADQEPTKIETARAIANVCRVLHSEKPLGSSLIPKSSLLIPSEEDTRLLLRGFYSKYTSLTDVLLYLGLQSKFPILRSDLWFVLALMIRSTEGAVAVTQLIQQHPELVGILAESVAGKKVPGEQTNREGNNSDSNGNALEGSKLDLSTIGRDGPGQLEQQQVDPASAAAMIKVDRENGLVLISELLKRCPEKLPTLAKNTFSRILDMGGKLVLGDRRESQ